MSLDTATPNDLFPPAFTAHSFTMAKDAQTTESPTTVESPSTEVIAESIESATIVDKIEETAITEPGGKKKKRKQKFSSRIVLGAHTSLFPMVCSDTGAVAAITIPTIPGKAFIYRSPFAVIGNCHSIAEEGPEYLYKLEAQLLAAIVITLAAEHRLFQYQPSDTGAQKNAVLRTVRRETLVSAILFIHSTVNSFRASKIPSLSCIPSEDMLEYGMDTRMTLWLKTCIDYIFPPVSAKDAPTSTSTTKQEDYFLDEEEESEAKIQKKISAQTHALTKAKLATTRRNFKTFKNESVANIKYLYTGQKISLKLKNFLLGILSEELLISSDGAMVDLLCTKLDQLNLDIAAKLAIGIKRFRREFTEQTLTEFTTDSAPAFSSMTIGKYDATTEQSEENEFASDAPLLESPAIPANSVAITKPLSFMERIKAKKALAQQNLPAPASQDSISKANNEANNEFGIPSSSLLHSSSISNMPDAPF